MVLWASSSSGAVRLRYSVEILRCYHNDHIAGICEVPAAAVGCLENCSYRGRHWFKMRTLAEALVEVVRSQLGHPCR